MVISFILFFPLFSVLGCIVVNKQGARSLADRIEKIHVLEDLQTSR